MNKMIKIIDFINTKFPKSWISNYYEDDETGEIGLELQHPSNKEQYLTLLILPNVFGVGVLLEKDRDIEIDLSGFDYSYKLDEYEKAIELLNHFYYGGKLNSSS